MAASPALQRSASSASSQGSPSGRHRCDRCPSSFVRLEHLKRHQRDHWESKPFVCALCGKGFTRSDTLKRHETVHAAMSQAGENLDSTQTRSRRGPRIRACRNCAQARARCSGDDVCARCSSKALSCEYPEKRRKITSTSASAADASGSGSGPLPRDLAPHSEPDDHPTWAFANGGIPPPQPDLRQLPNGAAFTSAPFQQTQPNADAQRMANSSPHDAAASVSVGQHQEPFQGQEAAAMVPVASNYQTQPSEDIDMNLDAVYDPNLYSINWLPTAFNDDLDYAAFSAFGMPLQVSNMQPPFSTFTGDQVPLDIPRFQNPQREQHDSPRDTSSSQTSSDSTGRFYATSVDGARMPFVTQGKRRSINIANASHIRSSFFRDQSTFAFPQAHLPIDDLSPNLASNPQMSPGAYERIVGAFKRVCQGLTTPFPPFSTQHLPSPAHFSYFTQLYFEHFHPILPVLHPQTLRLDEENWLLALSIAAIGCRYADSEELLETTLPMTEFLRRAVIVEAEYHFPQERPLQLLQAMLFNEIGLMYSGSTRFLDAAQREHGRFVEAIRTWNLLPPVDSEKISWSLWAVAECKNRLAYAIWLIDCMVAYHHDQKPFLCLEDMQGRLPCNEELWDATSEEEWQRLCPKIEANPPINEAMHRLYVNKKVKTDLGEFSRVLLLHGIFHETWAVAKYHRRSLASWIPSAEKPLPENSNSESSHPSAERSLYLPENPLYSKWRNAACDCIDALHWAANATIAQNSGSEHATVFHLHASRTVLLVPFGEIGALARSMASWASKNDRAPTDQPQPLPELTRLEGKVVQWVQKDQHKARLAMIHAGALYWHARRFSKAAWYEPSAVYLATLAMWAYASYTALATKAAGQQHHHHRHRPSSSRSGSPSPSPPDGISPSTTTTTAASAPDSLLGAADDPTFIRLDRPNDDEMVQLYVRNGHPSRMKANVTGVGNLASPMGPERVLREGCRMLAPMALTWGVAHEYVRILSAMAEVVASVRERAAAAGGL
ncbi:putative C2H2 transcription protein [Neofusicoccum parvum]|uniref:C2H2 transcription protein n=1 Tax=Neofusicoccum parvum TaxID=310453 RepID=A0ACB5SLM2_9PEZI|nr:putative C2H2 transcription protein [Neofusicoccum parvum]